MPSAIAPVFVMLEPGQIAPPVKPHQPDPSEQKSPDKPIVIEPPRH